MLRTPKGWTGPKVVDGLPVEGTFRAHQVPLADVREDPEHLAQLEAWMRSYRPEELFDERGRLRAELAALAPTRRPPAWARIRTPTAAACSGRSTCPTSPTTRCRCRARPPSCTSSTRQLGKFLRDIFTRNRAAANFRLFCPDETNSNRLGDVFEVENRCSVDPLLEATTITWRPTVA